MSNHNAWENAASVLTTQSVRSRSGSIGHGG